MSRGRSAAADDAAEPRDQPIDLGRLFAALLRRRRWIVLPTLAALIGAGVFVEVVAPRYTGVAKVLLENQESYYTRPDKAQADQGVNYDPEGVQSEAETVASADLARKAIAKLGLAADPEYAPTAGGVMGLVGALFGGGGAGEERVVDLFLSRLAVFPVPRSRVLQIEFSSADPELAARGANTVAQLFLASQEDAKKASAKTAGAWLSKKIDELRAKVAEADAKVENFRAESGLLAGANGQTINGQQLSELNAQLATVRSQQAAAAAKAQQLRAMVRDGRLGEAQDALKDDSLRRYFEQRVALKAQWAEQSRTLLPEHPRIKELTAEIAGLDVEIRTAAMKSVRGLENEARIAGAQVESLRATIARQSKTVAEGNVDEVQLRALDLEAKAARDQLESYLQKYREAMARDTENAAPADARVIATAAPPRTPTFPKKAPTVLLAALAAFLVSAGIAAASALMGGDAAPSAVAPREEELEPPTEGESEEAVSAPAASAAPLADAAPAGAFRSAADLADRLADAAPAAGPLVVLFAGHESGRTLAVALEAARRLSARGATALLDLGATQSWFADILDREQRPDAPLRGFVDLLSGEAEWSDVIRRDLSSRLDVIPSGGAIGDLDGLDDSLAALSRSYETLIVHASDWRAPAARAALRRMVAAVIVAPASRLAGAVEALRAEAGDDCPPILGLIGPTARAEVERAA